MRKRRKAKLTNLKEDGSNKIESTAIGDTLTHSILNGKSWLEKSRNWHKIHDILLILLFLCISRFNGMFVLVILLTNLILIRLQSDERRCSYMNKRRFHCIPIHPNIKEPPSHQPFTMRN